MNLTFYESCILTVRSSRYIVFDKKSIPMVAYQKKDTDTYLFITSYNIHQTSDLTTTTTTCYLILPEIGLCSLN